MMLDGSDFKMSDSPIGSRMAGWRSRRGLSRADLANRCGLTVGHVADLESGRDWVDRRGVLVRAAAVLRVGLGDLTGQPYPPVDERGASVAGFPFRVRRVLGQLAWGPEKISHVRVDDLAVQTDRAAEAARAGNEFVLAGMLPFLIAASGAAVAGVSPGERGRAEQLHHEGLLLATGLLRRLGYWDLAWVALRRAKQVAGTGVFTVFEEARLLLDCGRVEEALTVLSRSGAPSGQLGPRGEIPQLGVDPEETEAERSALDALIHAVAGRHMAAARLLDEADSKVRGGAGPAVLDSARLMVVVESGALEQVAGLPQTGDRPLLPAAFRVPWMVASASVLARRGDVRAAVALLVDADRAAPLLVRLDPFARELLAVLPSRAIDRDLQGALRTLAAGAGLTGVGTSR